MSKRGLLLCLMVLLVSVSFSGCIGDDDDVDAGDEGGDGTGGDGGDDPAGNGNGSGGEGSGGDGSGTGADGAAPTAAFDIVLDNGTNATTGVPIDFNASSSSDPDGENLSFAWDFGDDATGEGVALNHTYAEPGNYTVTLTVTDASGLTAQANQTLTVVNATIEPGVLTTVDGSVLLPNPSIALFSGLGFGSLDDHKANGGMEGTHWQVHTVTGVPEGIATLRFLADYTTPDAQTAMKLAIKVFPEDGSGAVATSSFPSGRPDLTLEGDDLGESTYHVFVYTGTGADVSYTLEVSYT